MSTDNEPVASIAFDAEIIQWRGPAPYLFVAIPEHHVGEIKYAARHASYGWGVVPVEARIGAFEFTSSLFPRNGTYLLPIKVAAQRATGVVLDDTISVMMRVKPR